MVWFTRLQYRVQIKGSQGIHLAVRTILGAFFFSLYTGRLGCQAMRRTETRAHVVKGGQQEPSQSVQVLGEFRRGGCRVRCAFKLPFGRRQCDLLLAGFSCTRSENQKRVFLGSMY